MSAWMKIRVSLPNEPEVVAIARALGVSRQHAVGCLVMVWALADEHAKFAGDIESDSVPMLSRCNRDNIGTAPLTSCPDPVPPTSAVLPRYTAQDIDEAAKQPGFATAMESVGWLRVHLDGVEFPNWHYHNASSAKRRACEQKKKQNQRTRRVSGARMCPDVVPMQTGQLRDKCPDANGTSAGPEKRREDIYNPPTPQGGEVAFPSEGEQGSLPGQTLDQIREGKDATVPRRETASDHPELHPIARRVADYFDQKVRPAQPARNYTASVVVARLLDGLTEADLRRVIDAYARRCDETEVPRKSRRACHTFFAKDTGSYLEFLEAKPSPRYVPPPQPQKPREV